MKFSPGPWKWDYSDNVFRLFTATNGVVIHQLVATARKSTYINGKYLRLPPTVVRANAVLLSAAPELLEAAKFFAEFGGANAADLQDDPVIARHLNAIRKAEGES